MVSFNGTFVNNYAASNDTILYRWVTCCFWMYLRKWSALLIVNFNLFNDADILVKYFSVLYVAVLTRDIIVLTVNY